MMHRVTEEQATLLRAMKLPNGVNYAPVEDINGNLFISPIEVSQSNTGWVSQLPLEDFEPKITEAP